MIEENVTLVVYKIKKIMKKFIKKYSGIVVFMCFTIVFVLLLTHIAPKPDKPLEGIPHNYYHPDVWEYGNIDSLQNIIDSLQLPVDTIQYESIDTTVIHWPWGREEFYYFKYKHVDINYGDTIDVKATMYHPVESQCDSDPLVTADGSIIDPYCVSDWNWIAVSRDLLVSGGGCFNYGDSVYVIAGHKTGWYIVHDTMNKRKRKQIDFLESIGTQVYRYKEAEVVINS